MPRKSETEIKYMAENLAKEFDNKQYFKYYCKVVINLSEAQIMDYLEQSRKAKQPSRYFSYLCNKAMKGKIWVNSWS